MSKVESLLGALGMSKISKKSMEELSEKIGISINKLKYYNENNLLPDTDDLIKIEKTLSIGRFTLMIKMGIVDIDLMNHLRMNLENINSFLDSPNRTHKIKKITPKFKTKYGELYKGDCLDIMKNLESESIDLVFADPPFNLNKFYLSNIDDNLTNQDYLHWCEKWLNECIRLLKPGGTLFLWNLPKWNTYFSHFLNSRLVFKHWICTDIKYSLPIKGRLYPSHYSLLMYAKGEKANTFNPDRMPMDLCPYCYKDLKDYGGYKGKMNPKGINLSDVWLDIPPVRHKKYKARKEANELSIKLLDRIIEMSSNPGDTVFDPFGGSGTTYIVSEIKKRKWIGIEIGPEQSILDRFSKIDQEIENIMKYRKNYNHLFPPTIKRERKKRGLWTDETFIDKVEQLDFFDTNVSTKNKEQISINSEIV